MGQISIAGRSNGQEDVRQLVILLHERRMKVIVDVNMTLGLIVATNTLYIYVIPLAVSLV